MLIQQINWPFEGGSGPCRIDIFCLLDSSG